MTNLAVIDGYVGADPNYWSDDKGAKTAYVNVACNEYWRDKDTGERRKRTEWIAVRVTNARYVQQIEASVRKGDHVAVSGILRTVKRNDAESGATTKKTYVCVEPYNGFFAKSAEPQHSISDTHTPDGEAT